MLGRKGQVAKENGVYPDPLDTSQLVHYGAVMLYSLHEGITESDPESSEYQEAKECLRGLARPLCAKDTNQLFVKFMASCTGSDALLLNALLEGWVSARTDHPKAESPLLIAIQRIPLQAGAAYE